MSFQKQLVSFNQNPRNANFQALESLMRERGEAIASCQDPAQRQKLIGHFRTAIEYLADGGKFYSNLKPRLQDAYRPRVVRLRSDLNQAIELAVPQNRARAQPAPEGARNRTRPQSAEEPGRSPGGQAKEERNYSYERRRTFIDDPCMMITVFVKTYLLVIVGLGTAMGMKKLRDRSIGPGIIGSTLHAKAFGACVEEAGVFGFGGATRCTPGVLASITEPRLVLTVTLVAATVFLLYQICSHRP